MKRALQTLSEAWLVLGHAIGMHTNMTCKVHEKNDVWGVPVYSIVMCNVVMCTVVVICAIPSMPDMYGTYASYVRHVCVARFFVYCESSGCFACFSKCHVCDM